MKFCNGMPSKGSIGVNRKVMVFLDTELSAAIDIPCFFYARVLPPRGNTIDSVLYYLW